jgi:uncharacterized membrane protein
MARLGAIATAIAAVELIVVHRALTSGVYRWSVVRRGLPFGVVGDLVFASPWPVLAVQLASAVALPWTSCAVVPWLAFATTFLISIRFRGTYNGGSDAMLLVVLLALAVARTDERLAPAALGYAAAQLILSYAVSGFAKLREPRWRDGTAMDLLVRLPQYGVPPRLIALLTGARAASFAMLAFECAFPIALVDPRVCVVVLGIAGVFHVVNAVVFGLNRFLWAWLAAFPALLFWVERLHA